MLKSRFIINRITHKLDQISHIDLLHLSRRIWKLRLESRRLSNIESEILGIERTKEEVPSWLIPQVYFDYLNTRDAFPLAGVFYYNEMNIISLAVLFQYICSLSIDDNKLTETDILDIVSIGDLFRKDKNYDLEEKYFRIGFHQDISNQLPKDIIHKYVM